MAVTDTKPLVDSVYSRLRELILSNQLRPGQKLVDRDLAALIGVSRTPVRQALARLAMIGLVEARSRRGYYVAQYTPEQIADLYEFRKILEVNSARLAARNAEPAHLRELKRILHLSEKLTAGPESRAKTVEFDLQIHALIARASGNASLQQASCSLMDMIKCFVWVDWMGAAAVADPVSIAASHHDHQAIVNHIIEKDGEGAAKIMAAHIDRAREGLTKMFQERAELRSVVVSSG